MIKVIMMMVMINDNDNCKPKIRLPKNKLDKREIDM